MWKPAGRCCETRVDQLESRGRLDTSRYCRCDWLLPAFAAPPRRASQGASSQAATNASFASFSIGCSADWSNGSPPRRLPQNNAANRAGSPACRPVELGGSVDSNNFERFRLGYGRRCDLYRAPHSPRACNDVVAVTVRWGGVQMAKTVLGRDVLEMALVGYQAEKARVGALIATIQTQLGQRGPGRPKAGSDGRAPAPHKRTLSAAVRKRMAAAQRKRWAAYKKEKATAKPKRHISEAGRKAMAAGGRRRWAAHRKSGAAA